MSLGDAVRALVTPAVPLLAVALTACGGASGGGGDWYYHYACNGDSECLITKPLDTPSGTVDVGPVESSCRSLQLFRTKFWGPGSWDACDHSPTFTAPGQGTPSITTIAPTAGVPGTQLTITGTNLPTTPGDLTLEIGGVTIPATAGVSTSTGSITFTIPNVPSASGPVTVRTPWGQATSSATFTILDDLTSVAWTGTSFVAVGDYGTALTSADGVHWTAQRTGVNPLTVSLTSVAWVDGQLIAGGTNGYLLSSPDGVSWTLPAHGLGMMAFDGIAWSGTQLVAAGSQAAIARSSDGASWTAALQSPSDYYNAIVWSGSQFVVAGFAILTSPDGATWTTRVPQGTPYFGLAWSGSVLAAVGAGGAVLTSPDGVTWTARTSHTTSDLHAVTWFKDRFVAVGAGGAVVTSPDGTTWTARSSGLSSALNGITASGTSAVAVGNAGVAISSADGATWSSPRPAAPTGVAGSHEVGQSSISWSPVEGATSYVVYLSTSSAVSPTSYSKRVTAAASPALVTGLAGNGYWYVVVTGVNGAGEGTPSAAASVCVGQYICGG